jgi:hypothetical protein
LKLLHRGSRDSFEAIKFHLNVDDKGAYVILVKSKENIYGGYADIDMNSLGNSFKK